MFAVVEGCPAILINGLTTGSLNTSENNSVNSKWRVLNKSDFMISVLGFSSFMMGRTI